MGLIVIPHLEKCTYCRECELICSLHHEKKVNPKKSRIRVMKVSYVKSVPSLCTHGYGCALECIDACPTGAIEEKNGFVSIDKDLCEGCAACVDVCPFNAIRVFDGKAEKCDLCGGEPKCVSLCSQGALTFEEGKTADRRVFGEIKDVVEARRKDYELLQV